VTLWERAPEVGGQVNVAARIVARSEFTHARTYFEDQCRALGVRIECGVDATADRVLAFRPDAVILATGARPKPYAIPGAERVLTVWDALLEPERIGRAVAVIEADGNWPGVATAEHLADLGKSVTVVTGGAGYGGRITIYSMLAVYQRFRDKGIRVLPLRAVRAVENGGLVLEDLSTGAPERLPGIDTIVAAAGGVAEDGLARELRGRLPGLRMVGDCVAPRTALEAIFEGHAAGRAV
jgi:pyruvate/2-oxoglutarate dehydrogenase complex dihydrolipoamide dehydrogenase (E3) component